MGIRLELDWNRLNCGRCWISCLRADSITIRNGRLGQQSVNSPFGPPHTQVWLIIWIDWDAKPIIGNVSFSFVIARNTLFADQITMVCRQSRQSIANQWLFWNIRENNGWRWGGCLSSLRQANVAEMCPINISFPSNVTVLIINLSKLKKKIILRQKL